MMGAESLAGSGTRWIGAARLKGGKGYAEGPLGQIHYRAVGEGDGVPFLLIHQTPFGIAEFIDVQPALARAGRRSIASDNPGFGLSDPPPEGPLTVADLADNLVALLDHLAVERAIVVGHHTGAAIAAAFAARHPGRTAGVALHGVPLYTAEERAQRLERTSPPISLDAEGGHLSGAFKGIHKYGKPVPESLATSTWGVIGTLLSGPDTPTYRAVFANDMTADLAAIACPGLILSDRADSLHAADRKTAALRPDFTFQTFSEDGSFALMLEPGRWAHALLAFAEANGL